MEGSRDSYEPLLQPFARVLQCLLIHSLQTCKITVPLDYFKRDDFTDPYQYIQARTVEKYLVIFDTAETLRFKVNFRSR